MSQSNYEKYAVVKQQELLHKERNAFQSDTTALFLIQNILAAVLF